MEKYPHIDSIFKRDEKTHRFTSEYACPEFEYLKDNMWIWTEKIDGTNIRIIYDGEKVDFMGRTDNAQIPPHLSKQLTEMFPENLLKPIYEKANCPICLYGEGFGYKIQKNGDLYLPDKGVSFILFDVKIDKYWLKRKDIEDIAYSLKIKCVPVIGEGKLDEAIGKTMSGVMSTFGEFIMEGFVLKPKCDLMSRNGHRIITKIKHKDFK